MFLLNYVIVVNDMLLLPQLFSQVKSSFSSSRALAIEIQALPSLSQHFSPCPLSSANRNPSASLSSVSSFQYYEPSSEY